jgi:hypothetical protein
MRNVIIAGVLGGLLGGAVVGGIFGLFGRGSAASAAAPDASAKAIPEALMNKLKGSDLDSFASASRGYMYTIPDTEFAVFKANLSEFREQCTKSYGKPLGEFELVREQAAGSNAARLIYLEKFEKGGVAWYFQMYHSPDGWKLASVHWDRTLNFAFTGAP